MPASSFTELLTSGDSPYHLARCRPMEDERLLEHERLQIEQIRQLDMEELQVELVDDDSDNSSDREDRLPRGNDNGVSVPYQEFTFNTSLASLHSYLGEIDDTHRRMVFLDGGTVLKLPMFYLEGVVLFPEATLPLRVIQPGLWAAVESALGQVDAPHMIGVVGIHRGIENGRPCIQMGAIGTTAEIRQYKRLDDGCMNVVARGQQRFYLRRQWTDVEGAPCAEVQIIEEDVPLRTPKDAFGRLASIGKFWNRTISSASFTQSGTCEGNENQWDCMSDTSIQNDQSIGESSLDACGTSDASVGSDDEYASDQRQSARRSSTENLVRWHHKCERLSECESTGRQSSKDSTPRKAKNDVNFKSKRSLHGSKKIYRAPMTFWPQWLYDMYDSYLLAQRAADMWKQVIGAPNIKDLVSKPDILSFYIASRLPLSQPRRQELLEINGVSYRLQREIQLLERFNLVHCKSCETVIAKRSDMLVMSSDGPLNAYVNPYGYVSETMTFYNASGLVLEGRPTKEYSWFPGYAWTITYCASCHCHMGWLFTATSGKLRPKHFWGIRSCQVADDASS